jgi:manganese transport protein
MAEPEENLEHEADDLYGQHPDAILEPPTDLAGRLKHLGPGLVLVGSVVGSGEIILTTTLGSIVGFSMLWFVLVSCWSKNIVQAELGRYTVSSGEPFLHAFNRLPGKLPGFNGKKVSWYIYFWLIWIIPDVMVNGGIYGGAGQALGSIVPSIGSEYWTILVAIIAMFIVLSGTYRMLEKILTVLVVTFTLITVTCAILLQLTDYAITWDEMVAGMGFDFPEMAIIAALAMYGGTGVGTGEQTAYTYWCVEKGYARFAGKADGSDDWVRRARGWITVMQTDVKLTLILLTCATIPFYMLGAGVLHRLGQKPNGLETISVLSNMYTTTLGEWAFWLFIAGAFFVLFSTAISGLGANARIFADGLTVLGVTKRNDYETRVKVLRYWAVLAPIATATAYFYFQNPVWMLTVGQIFKAIKFPVIAGSVIYLRYKHLDPRIAPSWKADALLWFCFGIMLSLCGYIMWVKFLS